MQTLRSPRNVNMVDADLVTARLVEGTTTFLQNRLAPLNAFSKQFSCDPIKPLATCEARFVSAGGTAGTNLTNFEDATKFVGTNTNVPVTMYQITAGSHSTNAETQSGHALDAWLESTLGTFADAILACRSRF